jgi:hypothetical protein
MPIYTAWNGPMPTTAAQASLTVANGVKTMLQIATPATRMIQLIGWGYSIDIAPAGGIGEIELLQTDVAATVTAHVAAGVQPIDPNGTPSLVTLGVAATGYNASAEGSPTATRVFDAQKVPVAVGSTDLNYDYMWIPDARPWVAVSKFLRVRTTFQAAVPTMLCYITWQE